MSTPVKRKAGTPFSDADTSPKHTAPGASSPGPASPKSKSPTPAPGSPAPEVSGVLSGAHWLQQGLPEVDEDELDSTLGSDVESSTASISSSILNYRTLNGRTYHSDSVTDGEYWGPNDQKHLNALEIYAHGLFLMLDEKLYQAPLKDDIKHVVDIGTGPGYWAIDFADKFSSCEVTGTDISPIQPSWCPPNLNFQIDDATKEWTFRENHFDYIHIQFMNGAVEDWTELYKQAYRCCKPGGWIEHIDVSPNILSDDRTVTPGSAMDQYGKVLSEAGIKINRRTTTSQDGIQEAGMKEAGFVNLTVKDYKMPVSGWPEDPKLKQAGLCASAAISEDVEGVIQFHFGQVMGWTKEEISIFAAHLCQEIKEMKMHGYWPWKCVYAQKPLDA